jgi:hypothetical protein
MSSVHVARQGFITKSALPSVSRVRGTEQVADNRTVLLLNGNGASGAQNNMFVTENYGSSSAQGNNFVYFDGAGTTTTFDTLITSPPSASLDLVGSTATVECWVYPTARPSSTSLPFGESTIFAFRGPALTNATKYYSMTINNSGFLSIISDNGSGGQRNVSSTSIPLNQWTHIAWVRSGGTNTFYVNGTNVTSTFSSPNMAGFPGPTTDYVVYLGVSPYMFSSWTYLYPFEGYISNFRVVKGTAVYTSAFTPPTAPLTAITNTSLLMCQSSTIIDNSSNNFAITVNGDAKVATNTASGPVAITRNGNATQGSFSPFTLPDGQWSNFFDGTGDLLNISTATALDVSSGDFTIEGWVYPNSVTAGVVYTLSDGNTISSATQLHSSVYLTSSTFVFRIYIGSSFVTVATTAASANTWTHLALVRNGSTFTAYKNGVSVGTYTSSSTLNYGTGWKWGVGSSVGDTQQGLLTGYISNFRVVKGTAVYTSGFTPSTTSLTAVSGTGLLTCQSNRFRDNSSNNFAITRNGDVRVTPWSPFAPTSAYDPATNGGSGYFDGTGDFLSVAGNSSFSSTGDFTAEAWVYLNSASSFGGIISLRDSSGTNTGMGITISNTGNLEYYIFGGSVSVAAPLNQWIHVALVRSGSASNNCSCYLNGVRVGQFTSNNEANAASNVAAIGRYYANGTNQYWINGYISSVRYVVGTALYSGTTITVPTAPVTNITNTSLLLNFTNAGIFDTAGDHVIETVADAKLSTAVTKFGSASMVFDGTGDFLRMASSPLFNQNSAYTVEMWLYSTTSQTGKYIYSQNTTNFCQIGLNGSGRLYIDKSGVGAQVTAGTALATNQWVHVAMVSNGTTLNLYVNGVSQGTASVGSTALSTQTVTIGAYQGTGGLGFIGYIDDVRVTLGQARYTANFTPPITELITYGTSENIVNNSTYGVYQLA